MLENPPKPTGDDLWNNRYENFYPSASELRLALMRRCLFVVGGNCEDALALFKMSGAMTEELEGRDELLRKEMLNKVWQPYTGEFYTGGPAVSDDDKIIAELAALSRFDYDRIRTAKAKELGIRKPVLDLLVGQERNKVDAEEAGTAFLEDVEPWPDPVDGAQLLDELETVSTRFAKLPKHGSTVFALWVLLTYLTVAVQILPILAITSPIKRCGKTTVMSLLTKLARRALLASNITGPAIFRTIDEWEPTLLFDEADTYLPENDEMRGVINSGHHIDGAFVIRLVGDEHKPKPFVTFCPKAIAMIGKLPETLQDRAIELRLRRKHVSEKIEKLRHSDPHELEDIRRRCMRFANDSVEIIRAARPEISETLNDRAADNWSPLFAIADLAGGKWPAAARAAATALSAATDDESDSQGVMLLGDIRDIFQQTGKSKLPTRELLGQLHAREERPWTAFRRGKPLTARQLSRQLGQFDIKPVPFWSQGHTLRGYRLADMQEAFGRYVPENIVPPAPTHDLSAMPQERSNGAGSGGFSSARTTPSLADKNTLKPTQLSHSCGIADKNPETAHKGMNWVREAFLRKPL